MMTQKNRKWSSVFRVGKYKCHMMFEEAEKHLSSEWEPNLPPQHSLTKKEIMQYQAGRDALMAQVAHDVGYNILMID